MSDIKLLKLTIDFGIATKNESLCASNVYALKLGFSGSLINELLTFSTCDLGSSKLEVNGINIFNTLSLSASNSCFDNSAIDICVSIKNLRFSASDLCIGDMTNYGFNVFGNDSVSTSNACLCKTTLNGINGFNCDLFCVSNLNVSKIDLYRSNVLNSLFGKMSLNNGSDIVVLDDSGHIAVVILGFLGILDVFYIVSIICDNILDLLVNVSNEDVYRADNCRCLFCIFTGCLRNRLGLLSVRFDELSLLGSDLIGRLGNLFYSFLSRLFSDLLNGSCLNGSFSDLLNGSCLNGSLGNLLNGLFCNLCYGSFGSFFSGGYDRSYYRSYYIFNDLFCLCAGNDLCGVNVLKDDRCARTETIFNIVSKDIAERCAALDELLDLLDSNLTLFANVNSTGRKVSGNSSVKLRIGIFRSAGKHSYAIGILINTRIKAELIIFFIFCRGNLIYFSNLCYLGSVCKGSFVLLIYVDAILCISGSFVLLIYAYAILCISGSNYGVSSVEHSALDNVIFIRSILSNHLVNIFVVDNGNDRSIVYTVSNRANSIRFDSAVVIVCSSITATGLFCGGICCLLALKSFLDEIVEGTSCRFCIVFFYRMYLGKYNAGSALFLGFSFCKLLFNRLSFCAFFRLRHNFRKLFFEGLFFDMSLLFRLMLLRNVVDRSVVSHSVVYGFGLTGNLIGLRHMGLALCYLGYDSHTGGLIISAGDDSGSIVILEDKRNTRTEHMCVCLCGCRVGFRCLCRIFALI